MCKRVNFPLHPSEHTYHDTMSCSCWVGVRGMEAHKSITPWKFHMNATQQGCTGSIVIFSYLWSNCQAEMINPPFAFTSLEESAVPPFKTLLSLSTGIVANFVLASNLHICCDGADAHHLINCNVGIWDVQLRQSARWRMLMYRPPKHHSQAGDEWRQSTFQQLQ